MESHFLTEREQRALPGAPAANASGQRGLCDAQASPRGPQRRVLGLIRTLAPPRRRNGRWSRLVLEVDTQNSTFLSDRFS